MMRERYRYSDALGAKVMQRLLNDEQQVLLVDAGSRAGVTVGMVAVYNNCLVGKVSHVYPLYSKITLLTDSSCNIASYCATSGIHGVHEGAMKSDMTYLTHIHHYDLIHEGELVLSSGQGIIFPDGFALGRIVSIENDGLWKKATVRPVLDVERITYCILFAKGQRLEKNANSL